MFFPSDLPNFEPSLLVIKGDVIPQTFVFSPFTLRISSIPLVRFPH